MTKVCRLCLQRLARGAKYFNVNAVESFTGFMPYRDQLTTCIPEMALDLIPNPVVCNSCRTALKSAYDFKTRCLLVEKKIRAYIEQQPAGTVNYDLSKIFISDLPPINKMHILQKELEQDGMLDNNDNCQLLMQLQNEATIPITDEVEITNITKKRKIRMRESAHYCFKCWKKFDDVSELIAHKSEHSEDFVCNFCNQPFRSLQYLRRHNSICSKGNNKSVATNMLMKRPHLPTKAKNHLKRWLFRHTDHPYPTDLEKQMLMQETNLSLLQVENWFINARRRILQDLTKLKKHGIRCEDVSDNTLGLQLDLEEMITPPEEVLTAHSPVTGENEPPLENDGKTDHPEDVEEAIEAIAIKKPDNSRKSKPKKCYREMDVPIDVSIIKTELQDDR